VLLTRLVAQRKLMDEKMGAMHAEMMQTMMEGVGAGTANVTAAAGKKGAVRDNSPNGDNSEHTQHQH
jgi:hypothetical protein